VGEGSEFTVRLPTVLAPGSERATESRIAAVPDLSGLRVLVVDDNVDAASSLAMLLRTEGHEIRITHDGMAALRVAHEFRPHVVFLDIGLPGLDGFEVARALRREPSVEGILLVAMTGCGQRGDRERSREAGFDHHLVKPAEFDRVRQILASVDAKVLG
jgi:CheY-like chemotaxis protein